MLRFMSVANEGTIILVVEDIEETRDGIEKLLKTDGSHVGQDSPTEHLFFPSQQTLWNFNDLSFI
jgi:hypothetical protein